MTWPINKDIQIENKYVDDLYEGHTFDCSYQSKPYKRTKIDDSGGCVILPSLKLILEDKGSE